MSSKGIGECRIAMARIGPEMKSNGMGSHYTERARIGLYKRKNAKEQDSLHSIGTALHSIGTA